MRNVTDQFQHLFVPPFALRIAVVKNSNSCTKENERRNIVCRSFLKNPTKSASNAEARTPDHEKPREILSKAMRFRRAVT
jgi:hypothetical protein